MGRGGGGGGRGGGGGISERTASTLSQVENAVNRNFDDTLRPGQAEIIREDPRFRRGVTPLLQETVLQSIEQQFDRLDSATGQSIRSSSPSRGNFDDTVARISADTARQVSINRQRLRAFGAPLSGTLTQSQLTSIIQNRTRQSLERAARQESIIRSERNLTS